MKTDFTFEDEIGIVTLNNPPENYLPIPDFLDLEMLKEFVEGKQCKGIIFEGIGRHFSAGADLKKLYTLVKNNEIEKRLEKGKNILRYINNLEIPAIASVKGVCFGAGLEIALSCHMIIASEKSLFAFPETNHNLMPGLGGTVNLGRKTGYANAIKMILTGDTINSETAIKIGLADQLSDTGDVREFSMNIMRKMTVNKPIRVIKNVMRSIGNLNRMPYNDALAEETKLFCELAIIEATKDESAR
jgi:enoyl-CoA hydratase/carnithine racemase